MLLTTSEKQRQDVVCALTESKGGSVADGTAACMGIKPHHPLLV